MPRKSCKNDEYLDVTNRCIKKRGYRFKFDSKNKIVMRMDRMITLLEDKGDYIDQEMWGIYGRGHPDLMLKNKIGGGVGYGLQETIKEMERIGWHRIKGN